MTPILVTSAMEATWPPATVWRLGPWTLRDGRGGGKRVSAATLSGSFSGTDISLAEAAMREMGQRPLFQLQPEDHVLDLLLAECGYGIVDPVKIYAVDLDNKTVEAPPTMTTFPHWPPLGIAIDLWSEGGIDEARLAVMHRVIGIKAAVLARINDRAAGVAFVAMHGSVAMLHALEVTPSLRRNGVSRHVLQAAIQWAKGHDAKILGLAVTTANKPARALYASFGMQVVGQYHYRQM